MKLRFSYGLIFTIIVLAMVVLGTCLLSSKTVKPYNADGQLSNNTLEGMTTKDQGQDRVRYAEYPSGDNVNVENQHLIESDASSNTAQRVKSFPGSLYGPEDSNEKITTFADAKGSLTPECQRTASGMSNSMGYLCLDRQQLNLLTTRGGNQTCSSCYKSTDNCTCNK